MSDANNVNVPATTANTQIESIFSKLKLPEDTTEDYDVVRKTLKDALESGNLALKDCLYLAQQMDHPRAWEVFSGLMKNLAEVSEKLMDHQLKIREITGQKTEAPRTQTNNVIFTGSTKQLQQILKGNLDSVDIDEIDVTPKD